MTAIIPVFRDKFARGWPEHEDVNQHQLARYQSVADALLTRHNTDAHFATYSVPNVPRRLASDGVFAELANGLPMVLFVIDAEPEGHAPVTPEWWSAERAKLDLMLAGHPGGFVYRTRGGYRVVYLLAEPVAVGSQRDAERWKARYLAWLDFVLERYGIAGDRACKEWQRLFRLPFVVRDGQRQELETIGDATAIGTWNVEVTIPEPEPEKPYRPSRPYTPRPGDFDIDEFMAQVASGAKEYQRRGRRCWDVECPWEGEHSTKARRDTVVSFAPESGPTFHCLHNHCAHRRWRDYRRFHQPDWVPLDERPPMSDQKRSNRMPPDRADLDQDHDVPHVAHASVPHSEPPQDEPEQLRREAAPPWPYPVDALGPVLGAAAKRLHDIAQAPLALCGQSLLAAASLAVQPHADVIIDGRRIPLTLWSITVAESGERKSAIDSIALAAHVRFERERIEAQEAEVLSFQTKQEAYDAAIAKAKRAKGTPADIESAMRACGPAPQAPISGFLIVREPTIEAVQKIYLNGASSLGLFTDEGATFFGGHSMSKDHVMRTAGALSKLWDDGSSDRVRSGDGASKIYGRRLALHLLMQPVIAKKVLSDELLAGQGFLARALIAWPETTAGTRSYKAENAATTPEVQRYHGLMGAALAAPACVREGRRGELEPRPIGLSYEAKQTWIAAYNAIEKLMKPGAEYAAIRPWASKAPEQILRIAGVLTLLENHQAPQIEASAVTAASKLVAFYLNEAVRMSGVAVDPPEIENAAAILEWCRVRGITEVDSRTLLRSGPRPVRNVKVLDEAMKVLVRHRWARLARAEKRPSGGKPSRTWSIRVDVMATAGTAAAA